MPQSRDSDRGKTSWWVYRSTHKGHREASAGNVFRAAEAGSRVGVRPASRKLLRSLSKSGNNTNGSQCALALTSGTEELHQFLLVAASLQFVEERNSPNTAHTIKARALAATYSAIVMS